MTAPEQEPRADHRGILEGDDRVRHVSLQGDDASVDVAPSALRRWGWGMATLALLFVTPYVVPGLSRFAPWRPGDGYIPFWNIVGRELMGQGKQQEAARAEVARLEELARQALDNAEPAASEDEPAGRNHAALPTGSVPGDQSVPKVYPAYAVPAADAVEVAVGIENVAQLDHYYERLTLTELGLPGAITRASQWGDSVLGGDGLTSAIRRRLQHRFGDAGHGFHSLGRYNLSYVHQGVRYGDRGGWRTCEIIFKCEPDGRYGYAGVTSRSSGGGTSRWRTAAKGIGSSVSRFEFWYAKDPEGGRFQVKVDGEVERVIDTRADAPADAITSFWVPDGEHSFEVRAIGGGVARGYGVVLERDNPGIVWDELALIGSFTQRLDYQDPEHLAWQVDHRGVDMLVFMFGGNDVQRETMDLVHTMQPYEDEYARVLRKFKAGRPSASCLVMSLMDHGERAGQFGVQSRRIVPKLVLSQQKVALAEGCAFFNTFQAMGGKDSIARWYNARPQLAGADFSHPTIAGQELIATLLYRALMQGYAGFRKDHEGKPLPEVGPGPVRDDIVKLESKKPSKTDADAGAK
ncbi:MAG TPA: GDSL-type esterase/lipase family protein [Polyangiaceae bacterium]|nr:GDSL-type esterase/lipase family protein [Polyangiaceae bacterium]